MAHKTFKIHNSKEYKKMPVLNSAAAIQLTVGLKKYLLPNFKFIHMYPSGVYAYEKCPLFFRR